MPLFSQTGLVLRRIRMALALAVFLACAGIWLLMPHGRARRALARGTWRILLAGFGVAVTVRGKPLPEAAASAPTRAASKSRSDARAPRAACL